MPNVILIVQQKLVVRNALQLANLDAEWKFWSPDDCCVGVTRCNRARAIRSQVGGAERGEMHVTVICAAKCVSNAIEIKKSLSLSTLRDANSSHVTSLHSCSNGACMAFFQYITIASVKIEYLSKGDERLIEEVRKYRNLCDNSQQECRDHGRSEQSWIAIGSFFNERTWRELKERWKYLRGQFTKLYIQP